MFSEEMFSEENLIEDFSNEPMIEENSIPKRPPPMIIKQGFYHSRQR